MTQRYQVGDLGFKRTMAEQISNNIEIRIIFHFSRLCKRSHVLCYCAKNIHATFKKYKVCVKTSAKLRNIPKYGHEPVEIY